MSKDTVAVTDIVHDFLNVMALNNLYGNTDAYAALTQIQTATANSSPLDKWLVNCYTTYVNAMYPKPAPPPASTVAFSPTVEFVTVL